MSAGYHLIGSAGSLADLCAMVVERMYWSTCTPIETDDPKVWDVSGGRGVVEGLRIRQAGRRFRLERRV